MGESDCDHSHGKPNLASCLIATLFLILLIIISIVVYFTVFNPKDPTLTVNAVKIPSFSAVNSTFTFTFSEYVTVHNPNHGAFSHYESSVRLFCGGAQVGFLYVPAGQIGAGRRQYMAATFLVKSLPLSGNGLMRSVEMETRLEIAGRVRVLGLFTHHVEAWAYCQVAVSTADGSVLGFHC